MIPLERYFSNVEEDIRTVEQCPYRDLEGKLRQAASQDNIVQAADHINFWTKEGNKWTLVTEMNNQASGTVYYEVCGGENARTWQLSCGPSDKLLSDIIQELVERMKRLRLAERHKLAHRDSITLEEGKAPPWVQWDAEKETIGFYQNGCKCTRAFRPTEITIEGAESEQQLSELTAVECEPPLGGAKRHVELERVPDKPATWKVIGHGSYSGFRSITLKPFPKGKVTIHGFWDDQVYEDK